MDFRDFMHSKSVFQRKSLKQQVCVYVDKYLQRKRFSSEENKKEVRKRLVDEGCRIDNERKRKV